jgi:uncharacterized protein YwqG
VTFRGAAQGDQEGGWHMKRALRLVVVLAIAVLILYFRYHSRQRESRGTPSSFSSLALSRPATKQYFQEGATPTAADVLRLYRQNGLESLAREIEPACLPCINLMRSGASSPAGLKPGRTKLGGVPILPDPSLWPRYKGKSLSFVAQVALDELPRGAAAASLPGRGLLLVFYVADQSVFGFEPGDRGGWRVLYVDSLPAEIPPVAYPDDLPKEARYKEVPLTPEAAVSMPDPGKAARRLPLTDAQREEASDIYLQFVEHVSHQVLGHAIPIQDDEMQLECQLASHGIDCGGESGYKDPRVEGLKPGAENWTLLLQIDSDDKADMMWGDSGRLYFWITRDDLKNRRFDNVWLVTQCY